MAKLDEDGDEVDALWCDDLFSAHVYVASDGAQHVRFDNGLGTLRIDLAAAAREDYCSGIVVGQCRQVVELRLVVLAMQDMGCKV